MHRLEVRPIRHQEVPIVAFWDIETVADGIPVVVKRKGESFQTHVPTQEWDFHSSPQIEELAFRLGIKMPSSNELPQFLYTLTNKAQFEPEVVAFLFNTASNSQMNMWLANAKSPVNPTVCCDISGAGKSIHIHGPLDGQKKYLALLAYTGHPQAQLLFQKLLKHKQYQHFREIEHYLQKIPEVEKKETVQTAWDRRLFGFASTIFTSIHNDKPETLDRLRSRIGWSMRKNSVVAANARNAELTRLFKEALLEIRLKAEIDNTELAKGLNRIYKLNSTDLISLLSQSQLSIQQEMMVLVYDVVYSTDHNFNDKKLLKLLRSRVKEINDSGLFYVNYFVEIGAEINHESGYHLVKTKDGVDLCEHHAKEFNDLDKELEKAINEAQSLFEKADTDHEKKTKDVLSEPVIIGKIRKSELETNGVGGPTSNSFIIESSSKKGDGGGVLPIRFPVATENTRSLRKDNPSTPPIPFEISAARYFVPVRIQQEINRGIIPLRSLSTVPFALSVETSRVVAGSRTRSRNIDVFPFPGKIFQAAKRPPVVSLDQTLKVFDAMNIVPTPRSTVSEEISESVSSRSTILSQPTLLETPVSPIIPEFLASSLPDAIGPDGGGLAIEVPRKSTKQEIRSKVPGRRVSPQKTQKIAEKINRAAVVANKREEIVSVEEQVVVQSEAGTYEKGRSDQVPVLNKKAKKPQLIILGKDIPKERKEFSSESRPTGRLMASKVIVPDVYALRDAGKKTVKSRINVRQFTPQRTPYPITPEDFSRSLRVIYPKLEKVVYAGWGRRLNTVGKKEVGFFITTGATSSEARKRFKTSDEFGQNIWQLTA